MRPDPHPVSSGSHGTSAELPDRTDDLARAIEKSGYYPLVVTESVRLALAEEAVLAFLVQHEPTIDRDEVRRHITVVVLTPSRMVLVHTDEHTGDDLLPEPYTSTSTEAISLATVRSVVVQRMVTGSASDQAEVATPAEAVLTVGWGGVSRLDLEPAMCADPDCDADHGYTGVIGSDDFSMRVSAAADGTQAVDDLLEFAGALSARTRR